MSNDITRYDDITIELTSNDSFDIDANEVSNGFETELGITGYIFDKDHAHLDHLDYANSGHTGFASQSEMRADYAKSFVISQVVSTGVVTISLKNYAGEIIDTQTLDLDTEKIIVSVSLDYQNKKLIFTLKDGTTIECDITSMVSAIESKVSKVSTANRVYGTDASGNQTTYDKNSFGQVDDVEFDGSSVVTDKVATIPRDLSSYDNTTSNFQNGTQVASSISAHNNEDLENVHPAIREFIEDEIENRELACGALSDRLDEVEEVIPEQATSSNQLADKSFVNSSIENMAAFYVTKRTGSGTQEDPYQYVPFNTKAELNSTTVVYIGGVAKTPGKNDYTIVLADESKQGSLATAPTTRYMYPKPNTEPYDPTAWEFQYIVNNTGLTAAQVAALNSGITATKVSTYDGYAAQIAAKSVVSGTNDGTNWLTLNVNGTTKNIPVGTITDVKINNTSIVSSGVANIPVASASTLGVVKAVDSFGICIGNSGSTLNILKINAANASEISAKSNTYKPIVPSNLNIAIREGLGNNNLTWSDQYKQNARTTIGASAVSVSTTGTSTTEAKYITADGTEYKLAGGTEVIWRTF